MAYYIKNERGFYFDGYFTDQSCGWTTYRDIAQSYIYMHEAAKDKRKINKAYGRTICGITNE